MWYWEYQLKIWDEIDAKEEIRCGVVTGKEIIDAMKELYDYYGDEIMEVQMLKAIIDGVFDFQYAMEEENFDYVITRKM